MEGVALVYLKSKRKEKNVVVEDKESERYSTDHCVGKYARDLEVLSLFSSWLHPLLPSDTS